MLRTLSIAVLFSTMLGCGPSLSPYENPVQIGSVKVELLKAQVGQVIRLDPDSVIPKRAENATYNVTVRITNLNDSKTVEYRAWSYPGLDRKRPLAKLGDDFGTNYPCQSSEQQPIQKSVPMFARIKPGESVTDILAFELPIDKANTFALVLPAESVGQSGEFIFSIPRAMTK